MPVTAILIRTKDHVATLTDQVATGEPVLITGQGEPRRSLRSATCQQATNSRYGRSCNMSISLNMAKSSARPHRILQKASTFMFTTAGA